MASVIHISSNWRTIFNLDDESYSINLKDWLLKLIIRQVYKIHCFGTLLFSPFDGFIYIQNHYADNSSPPLNYCNLMNIDSNSTAHVTNDIRDTPSNQNNIKKKKSINKVFTDTRHIIKWQLPLELFITTYTVGSYIR